MDVLGIPAGEKEQTQDIPEAARVMEHFAQRDRFVVMGKLRDIFTNVVIEREEPLLGGESHAGRGELLRDAAHVKNGCRRESNAKLEAGGSVAFLANEVSVSDDSERAAGRVGPIVGGENLIYSALERVIFFLFPCHDDGCREGNDRQRQDGNGPQYTHVRYSSSRNCAAKTISSFQEKQKIGFRGAARTD